VRNDEGEKKFNVVEVGPRGCCVWDFRRELLFVTIKGKRGKRKKVTRKGTDKSQGTFEQTQSKAATERPQKCKKTEILRVLRSG